jgi:hypothetical protein
MQKGPLTEKYDNINNHTILFYRMLKPATTSAAMTPTLILDIQIHGLIGKKLTIVIRL